MSSAPSSISNRPPVAVPTLNESFLESERPVIVGAVHERTPLPLVLAKVVADYLVHGKAFTAADWERVFPLKTEAFEIDPEFYQFWFSPDAEDPTQLNCDTHFLPILRPETVVETTALPPPSCRHRFADHIDLPEYNLEVLGRLMQNPREGHPSRFAHDSESLRQNGKVQAGPPRYLVARKKMFARGFSIAAQRAHLEKLNERTHAGYEVLPSALDLATVAAVIRVATGVLYLGDENGMENRWSASRSENTVEYDEKTYYSPVPVIVGYQSPLFAGIVGGPGPSGGLQVFHDDFDVGCVGVVGLRKFSVQRKLNT